ncbi:C2H2 type zinc-finger-domain-containing protein [Triangularia setosa]|uniref:C2H2 type zinc-finger-domain-containing protein n=1 Tax=Triangularia setosa TaxID=2587417 RepID=A0AAN6WAU5_9PEZI|nr:C2H2 type zinc-finger-domain-containing protein [Podospora setosa]
MPDTTTATTTTTTTTNMALPSLSTSPPPSPQTTMQPFIPGQCLFCPHPSPTLLDSVEHMQKSHGLFIPRRQYLTVENLQALFEHLHLIIFGYQECIKCGTTRASVQAIQQHMTGKPGHCTFDISDPDSEFADLYHEFFEEPESKYPEEEEEDITPSRSRKQPLPVQVDEDSIRLPSGRIISKKLSSLPPRQLSTTSSSRSRHHRTRISAATAEIEYALREEFGDDETEKTEQTNSETPPGTMKVVLSKREKKRARAMEPYQLTRMSANDWSSLMHLPVSQQRALLATQQRHQEKTQTEERRQRAKIDRKGNKNLYAYWNTETPVYLCG